MKKENGFGLIILLISVAIIVYILVGAYSAPKTETSDTPAVNGGSTEKVERKSILERQLESIENANEVKKILENRNMSDIENY